MSFRSFKKELEKKKQDTEFQNHLTASVERLKKKANGYLNELKQAIAEDDKVSVSAKAALYRNALLQYAQAQDMLTNYSMALDLSEMQGISKEFVSSLNKIMKKLRTKGASIDFGAAEKNFVKGVEVQTYVSSQLKELLNKNHQTFVSSVDGLSELGEQEIIAAIRAEQSAEEPDLDSELDGLERELTGELPNRQKGRTEESDPPMQEKQKIAAGEKSSCHREPSDSPESGGRSEESDRQGSESHPRESGTDADPYDDGSDHYRLFDAPAKPYTFPPMELLDDAPHGDTDGVNEAYIRGIIEKVIDKLKYFQIDATVENYRIGSNFTRLELKIKEGIPLSRIAALKDDLAMALTKRIRLLLPIPGKALVGIEVENQINETVTLRQLLNSEAAGIKKEGEIAVGLGFDIEKAPEFIPFNSFPHLLIGGATGSGKSCFLQSLIVQMLYRYAPDELRLVMVDMKRVEFAPYNGIPHLAGGRVITEYEDTVNMFEKLREEMEYRYGLFQKHSVFKLQDYNKLEHVQRLPEILVIVDEYADIALSSYQKRIQTLLQTLAQKARACGIYLVVATQRPSVKVINGVIKANFPARIAFTMASFTDSVNILNASGAEYLLGLGDMLYFDKGKTQRLRAPFVGASEIGRVVDYIKEE